MLTTAQGLPAAANLQQAILFAQLQLLRQLEAQGRQREPVANSGAGHARRRPRLSAPSAG